MLPQGGGRRPRLRHGALGPRLCDRPELQQAMGSLRTRGEGRDVGGSARGAPHGSVGRGFGARRDGDDRGARRAVPDRPRDRGLRNVERRVHRRDASRVRSQPARPGSGRHLRRGRDEPDTLVALGSRAAHAGRGGVDRGSPRRARGGFPRHAGCLGSPGPPPPLHPSHGDVAVAGTGAQPRRSAL